VQKLSAGKTLAFHSYKGGTGKTTLVTNLAATFAMMGMRVCLLDFDLYAPSLASYFQETPEAYLNDLLAGEAKINDVLVDLSSELGLERKFFVGFSNPKKDVIQEIEVQHKREWQYTAIRRFLAAKKELFSENKIDYIFLDTSPGIKYWSMNTLAVADLLFVLMKISDIDIRGTKRMIKDIYESLTESGSKYFIILNKVPGASPIQEFNEKEAKERMLRETEVEREMEAEVIDSIPCFCDIQFNRHEFLYAVKQPKHQFSKSVLDIANKIRGIDQRIRGEEE
jgi:chromosome partitioning protein